MGVRQLSTKQVQLLALLCVSSIFILVFLPPDFTISNKASEGHYKNENIYNIKPSVYTDSSSNGVQHPNAYLEQSCYNYSNFLGHNTCCKTHHYVAEDLQLCAQRTLLDKPRSVVGSGIARMRWAIVGDSRVRQIFTSMAYLLRDTKVFYDMQEPKEHKNLSGLLPELLPRLFSETIWWDMELIPVDAPLLINYYWDPELDRLPDMINTWLSEKATAPHFLLTATGLHYMVNGQKTYVKHGPEVASQGFRDKITQLVPLLTRLSEETITVVQMIDHVLVRYVPKEHKKVKSNENIDFYNKILESTIPKNANVVLWDSTQPVADMYIQSCYPRKLKSENYLWICKDNTHMGYIAIHQYTNMLLNHVCNRHLPLDL